MKKKRLLDSCALLVYLKKELDYQRVLEILSVGSKEGRVVMNEINVGECHYLVARERGLEQADYLIDTIIPNLPIKLVSNTFDDIIAASRVKSKHSIPYADCFAVATAIREKAVIVTGDPDFKLVEGIVEIEWLAAP